MKRADLNDRTNIPCSDGGELHRHVIGQEHCGDCSVVIIQRGFFIRPAAVSRGAA